MRQHRGLIEGARHAIAHPERARRYVRRLRRDALLRLKHRGDHLGYYAEVVGADIRQGEATAVGNHERAAWRKVGRKQFDYLRQHGLEPQHTMLEIGCGNLRAGWRFIDFLDAGHYYGVDISPDVILAAQDTLVRKSQVEKLPYLTVVKDMSFAFLPAERFDWVHAHSVFSHCPLPVIEECFANVARVMKSTGTFDFTFYRTEGKEFGRLREDFYYRTETLVAAAARHGFNAVLMADWEGTHPQSKLRLTRH
ncbi:MAG: class I SAM-dependent methyltransferase [Frankiaceae bacterium]|nr:class I SAM-dependent methyltransferase [Frankiaceae bacterium]